LQGLHQETSTSKQESSASGSNHGEFTAYTVTTSGILLAEIPCPRGTAFRSITIREVGGQMCPLWPQYYDDCHCVIFVLDTSDHTSIADAALELLDALKDPRLAGKPAALILSKQDRPLVASRAEIEFVLHLDSLERTLDFTVFELTSIPDARGEGTAMSEVGGKEKAGSVVGSVEESPSGVEALFTWLVNVKMKALGIASH
jgi:GTPase SAR1 family protein